MGKVMFGGGKVGMAVPITGISASDLAVGSTVYLNENGSPVPYLVVNQGIPSNSSLYDNSCNGTWLLRKGTKDARNWDADNNGYANSDIHAYLNSTVLARFDEVTQVAIKEAIIPYCRGNGSSTVYSGADGLVAKLFLLSGCEVGFISSNNSALCVDGAKLAYFASGAETSANNLRKVTESESDYGYAWWTRTAHKQSIVAVFEILQDGTLAAYDDCSGGTYGVRPALILPSNAIFDEATLIFRGVK